MAQNTVLALGRTAATSSVITVTTTPVTVSIYSDVAGPNGLCSFPGEAVCPVYMDSPGSVNPPLILAGGTPVLLSQQQTQVVLTSPGDYYVMRPLLPSTVPNVGVFTQT